MSNIDHKIAEFESAKLSAQKKVDAINSLVGRTVARVNAVESNQGAGISIHIDDDVMEMYGAKDSDDLLNKLQN